MFYRYGLLDLTSPDRFWKSYRTCRQEDGPRNFFYSGCYVFDNGGSYNHPPARLASKFGYFFPEILLMVLMSMLVDCFNSHVSARSIDIAAHKIIGEPMLVFIGL
jgi:hypothetical protein